MIRAFLIFLTCSSLILADPAWLARITPEKAASHPPIPSSTLEFSLSWKGMLQAGTLRIEFEPPDARKSGAFVTKSSASSIGPAAALFPYSHSYWSESIPATWASRYFRAVETDDKETIVTENRYSSKSVSISEKTAPAKGGAPSPNEFSFPHGPARDMLSAILFIRSQKLAPGESHVLLLLPFTSPYLLTVRVEAREAHMGRPALRISFAMEKIDRKTHHLKPYAKLKRPVTLWLSDDADRVPLELRASVYIGDVRAILTDFKKHP